MGKESNRARMTWQQCGEVLAQLQASLFVDRNYWVHGNVEQGSMGGRTLPRSR
jgi:hypothetical protein